MHKKNIVITGASSGIGEILTKTFAKDGHNIFICARRTEKLAQISAGLTSVRYANCDVGSEESVKEFFSQVRKYMPKVDVLFHCAATIGPIGLVHEVNGDEWLEAIKVNLHGAFLITKYVIPFMPSDTRSRIILLSGGGAFDPMPNMSAYGVAKAGIVRLAETLAVELAPQNIAVNIFAPGFVATEIFKNLLEAGPAKGGKLYQIVLDLFETWDEKDIHRPIECARYLISDEAALLTGKTISARHDPWDQPEFQLYLQEISNSKLFATDRINLTYLQNESFVAKLNNALENKCKKEYA